MVSPHPVAIHLRRLCVCSMGTTESIVSHLISLFPAFSCSSCSELHPPNSKERVSERPDRSGRQLVIMFCNFQSNASESLSPPRKDACISCVRPGLPAVGTASKVRPSGPICQLTSPPESPPPVVLLPSVLAVLSPCISAGCPLAC